MSFKSCSKCKIEKALSSFSKDKYHVSGYKSACKECANVSFSKWRNKNIEQVRKQDRKKHYIKKYKLSAQEASSLVESRTGLCSICKTNNFLVVDHCHTSGEVRGLICSACNSVLGYAKDNVKTLAEAINYLEKFYG